MSLQSDVDKVIKKYKHFSITLNVFDGMGKCVKQVQRIADANSPISQKLLKEELDIFVRRIADDITTPGTSDF